MLRRLYIRDFVIVDTLDLSFEGGFGALTGETGAGKSILIDALSLAMGERAAGGVVRAGRDKAEVAAGFGLPGIEPHYPTAAGLVAAVGDWAAEPGPLLPLYLRRPDAKTLAERGVAR